MPGLLSDQSGRSEDSWRLRSATSGDAEFLASMLAEAACWRPGLTPPDRHALLADRHIGHYIAGWQKPADLGVVAVGAAGQRPLGAAWCRYLQADDPGYGYIADDIPEIVIGVVPDRRRQGIGQALLHRLIGDAARRQMRALSLSVEHGNPAASLYGRLGFAVAEDTGGAWTMILHLPRKR